jgi:hypothetical protein
MQLNRFDNEVEVYCSLILQPLSLRERFVHFYKFLFKKDSFNDYYSGISFYRKEQEGLLELTKLNAELSDALSCKKEDDYVCEVKSFERKFPITRMWFDQKTKKHMEEKREVPEKGIAITNVYDPPDLNSMSVSNISDCFGTQEKAYDDEFSIQVVLNRNVSFFKRFWRGIKYVFGKCPYFQLVLNRKAIEELKKVVEVNFQYEPDYLKNDGFQILTAYGCPMPAYNCESMYRSPELMALAERAVQAVADRKNENIEEWAERLAVDIAKADD